MVSWVVNILKTRVRVAVEYGIYPPERVLDRATADSARGWLKTHQPSLPGHTGDDSPWDFKSEVVPVVGVVRVVTFWKLNCHAQQQGK